jgi:hypothetical protein
MIEGRAFTSVRDTVHQLVDALVVLAARDFTLPPFSAAKPPDPAKPHGPSPRRPSQL